jgi:hypothetical protein
MSDVVSRAVLTRSSLWERIGPGVVSGSLLAAAYLIVVRAASGSPEHLADQVLTDWYLLAPIVVGFGVQVALFVELRRRRALEATVLAGASAGTATSVAGMVGCCAHHVAELAPFLGLAAAAPFLYRARVAFMLLGLAANGAGILVARRRLRRLSTTDAAERSPDGVGRSLEEVRTACAGR